MAQTKIKAGLLDMEGISLSGGAQSTPLVKTFASTPESNVYVIDSIIDNINNTMVFVDGLYFSKTQYSVDEDTIILDTSLPQGIIVEVIYSGSIQEKTIVLPTGSITFDSEIFKMDDSNITFDNENL